MTLSTRYKVVEGKENVNHDCCYNHAIVDTTKKGGHAGFDLICECLNEEVAELLCSALNLQDSIDSAIDKYLGDGL